MQQVGSAGFNEQDIAAFYTKDLAGAQTLPIQDASEEAIMCIHGLALLK